MTKYEMFRMWSNAWAIFFRLGQAFGVLLNLIEITDSIWKNVFRRKEHEWNSWSVILSRAWLFHVSFRSVLLVFYTVPRPLGMESGAIKDSQINASSETENETRNQSRLNSGPEKAWCVQESDSVRTLTINLTKPYYITQVTFPTDKEQSPGKIM